MAPTVLVTGAAGFVGSHLVDMLGQRGAVIGWTRATVDLLDRAAVREAIAALRPTQVYHCAGAAHVATSWADRTTPLSGNVLATHHLLDALHAAECPARVLVPGSATVYAPSTEPIPESGAIGPSSPYALSKLAQEQLALRATREDGVETIVTRSFNHTGPRQQPGFAAASFARQVALIEKGIAEPVIRVGNLDARRDMTDVRDVARAYIALMENGESGTIYNVASGVARPVRSVLEGLLDRAKVTVAVEVDPERLRPNDVPVLVGDATRLRRSTGWTPEISFDQMLDDLLDWWRGACDRMANV